MKEETQEFIKKYFHVLYSMKALAIGEVREIREIPNLAPQSEFMYMPNNLIQIDFTSSYKYQFYAIYFDEIEKNKKDLVEFCNRIVKNYVDGAISLLADKLLNVNGD